MPFNASERSDPLKTTQTIFALVFNDQDVFPDAAEYDIQVDFERM